MAFGLLIVEEEQITAMLQNYIKVMYRSLLKRKAFTLINLFGLASGMAICLLLALYIHNEFGCDDFHKNGDQIYRLALERKYPGRTALHGQIPHSIGQAVKQEFPEVLDYVRILSYGSNMMKVNAGDKAFEQKNIVAADSNFFRVFSAEFLQGNNISALQKPGTAVVNESTAKIFFGSSENAMGKRITLNGSQHYTVDGVCKDWTEKSHFQFSVVVSLSSLSFVSEPNFYDFSTYTYLLLNKNASAKSLEGKLPLIVEKYVAGTIEKGFGESYEDFIKEGNAYRYFLQPLKSIHLHSNLEDELRPTVNIKTLYLAGAIAVFIMALACINFINLSTALSVDRSREVGVRKTFGSKRSNLVRQFLAESVFFSFISVLFAILLSALIAPLFRTIAGVDIALSSFLHPLPVILVVVFAIFIGIIAGVYPALVLSSFNPIVVLKGRFKSSAKGLALRNGLVVFQFTVSVVLIVCTVVVNNQMQLMLGGNLGFKKDHIVALEGLNNLQSQRNAFIDECSKVPGVGNLSRCSNLPDGKELTTCAMQALETRISRTQNTIYVDDKYLKLLDLKMTEGRFFSKDLPSDSFSLVLNEKAVKDFGLKTPIGSKITSTEPFFNSRDGKGEVLYTVIGVVKDFHFQSLHSKIAPLVMANSNRFGWSIAAVQIETGQFQNTLSALQKAYKKFDPKRDLSYSFLDTNVAEQYKAERSAQQIFSVFSLLAIGIACIGLFGLVTYTTLQRAKEISVRKILGASAADIFAILSRDFLRLVILATMLALPVSWWAMNNWLQNFAYRVNVTWWAFIIAGIITTVIAFCTISLQALKAAISNPVKSLRTE